MGQFPPTVLNQFLADLQNQIVGYATRLGFWQLNQKTFLNRFFVETGLTGMLEASDYYSIDIVSPLIGAVVNDSCSPSKAAKATKRFMAYVVVVSSTYRDFLSTVWRDSELEKCKFCLVLFKESTCQT